MTKIEMIANVLELKENDIIKCEWKENLNLYYKKNKLALDTHFKLTYTLIKNSHCEEMKNHKWEIKGVNNKEDLFFNSNSLIYIKGEIFKQILKGDIIYFKIKNDEKILYIKK